MYLVPRYSWDGRPASHSIYANLGAAWFSSFPKGKGRTASRSEALISEPGYPSFASYLLNDIRKII